MSPTAHRPQPVPRKTLDITLLDLQGDGNGGLLSEDSMKALEEHCKNLCAKHLSLDPKDILILRQGISPIRSKHIHRQKREYAVACSITSGNLFCLTLHYRKTQGFNVFESEAERASEKYKVFSVFFQVSTVAELKDEPAPQIIITPNKEDQHHATYPA